MFSTGSCTLTSEPRFLAAFFFSRSPFEVVLRQLPEQVLAGLRAAGLDDPAILESYPFDSYGELVDSGATNGGILEAYHYHLPVFTISVFLSSLVSLRRSVIIVLYVVSWRKGSARSGDTACAEGFLR